MKEKTEKHAKHTKKEMSTWLKVILILLLIIIIAAGILIGKIANDKLSKINFKEVDDTDLEINEDLQSEIEGLSIKDYDKVINILLLGSDSKEMDNTYGGNSDAMIIVSINPKYKSIKLISIPRDTAAYIDWKN